MCGPSEPTFWRHNFNFFLHEWNWDITLSLSLCAILSYPLPFILHIFLLKGQVEAYESLSYNCETPIRCHKLGPRRCHCFEAMIHCLDPRPRLSLAAAIAIFLNFFIRVCVDEFANFRDRSIYLLLFLVGFGFFVIFRLFF